MTDASAHIIVFDGVCILCNSLVKWVIMFDKEDTFRFIPMQSPRLAHLTGLAPAKAGNDTVYYLEDQEIFEKSEAVLRICRQLRGFRFLYYFRYVPRPFRDAIYDIIARYRYMLFGRKKECMVPDQSIRYKFLE